MTSERVFDQGLQLERTALSWQRTLLSLTVASLAVGRGLELVVGDVAWAVAGAGVAITVVTFFVVRRRYLRVHLHLTAVDGDSLPSGGRAITCAAIVNVAAGVSALVFVMVRVG